MYKKLSLLSSVILLGLFFTYSLVFGEKKKDINILCKDGTVISQSIDEDDFEVLTKAKLAPLCRKHGGKIIGFGEARKFKPATNPATKDIGPTQDYSGIAKYREEIAKPLNEVHEIKFVPKEVKRLPAPRAKPKI
jgi:hypothetical protein